MMRQTREPRSVHIADAAWSALAARALDLHLFSSAASASR